MYLFLVTIKSRTFKAFYILSQVSSKSVKKIKDSKIAQYRASDNSVLTMLSVRHFVELV